MKNKKMSVIDKILYVLVLGGFHEDYLTTDKNGDIIRTPAKIWHDQMLNNQKQR